MNSGNIAAFLLLLALFAGGVWMINRAEEDNQKIVLACTSHPTLETCKPCAEQRGRSFDVCRPIYAGLVLEARGKK